MRMRLSSGDVVCHWCGRARSGVWRGVLGCPLIAAVSAWVCVLAEGPPDDVLQVVDGEEGSEVEVLFERVAGLDIGKATLTACVRTPGPRGRRRETRTFSTMSRSLEVMRD